MKKNTAVLLLALCPLVPAASRLAYGIILSLSIVWLFLLGIFFREVVRKIDAGKAGPYIELSCLAGSATVFTLLLQIFFPVLYVSLGFYVYLSAFSCVLLASIDLFSARDLKYLPVLPFIPLLLFFSCVRELLGNGTISVPVFTGILELTVFPEFSYWGLGFWGTSGGAIILLGIFTWLAKFIQRRVSSHRRNA